MSSNSASVASHRQSDVSLFSPGGVPTVFNSVVLSSLISDQKYSMIKWSRTSATVENSAAIAKPWWSINADTDGLNIDCSLQNCLIIGSEHSVAWNFEGTRIGCACSLNSLVWISRFSSDTLSLDPVQSPFRPSTRTSLALEAISSAAID